MEKEQEVERERDRARSTKFFDPRFNFSEPPPKVWTRQEVRSCLRWTLVRLLKRCFQPQPSRMKPGRFRNTVSIGLHIQVN